MESRKFSTKQSDNQVINYCQKKLYISDMKAQPVVHKKARIVTISRTPRRRRMSYVTTKLSFSELEDSPVAYKTMRTLASKAGRNAAAEAKARGLSSVYLKNDTIVRVSHSGSTEILQPRLKRDSFYVKYKPATVLHVIPR